MHEIRLYDGIGGWGITAEDVAAGIPADTSEITVRINSPGGAVSDGLAIYHYLRDHAAKVTTIVDGYAASAASVVMLAGDERIVHPASIVMIHNPWGQAVGEAGDMRKTADVLDEHTEALLDIYEARTAMGRDELRALLADETWMRGEAAVEKGFADVLVEDDAEEMQQAAAFVSFARMLATIQEGNELMSKQKTRKEIEADLDVVNAELTAKQDEITVATEGLEAATARIGELEATAAAKDAEHAEAIEAMRAEYAALETARDEAVQAAQEAQTFAESERDEARADVDTLKAEVIELTDTVETLKAGLRDPSMVDAALKAIDDADAIPGAAADAEADEAEARAKAEADANDDEPKTVAEKYEAMAPGPERQAFWKANKRQIVKELEARDA